MPLTELLPWITFECMPWSHPCSVTVPNLLQSQREAEEIVESDSHLRPAFTQHLPANCKVMLIADIGKRL